MLKLTLLFVFAALAAGCSTTGDYKAYLQAQAEANRQAAEGQKPLVELTAQPGQPITGLSSLKVYPPTAAPVIQQSRPNEWAGVVGQGLGVLGTLGGIHYGGKAAVGLASEIRQAGTAGYAHIQAPGTVTTNTLSGTGTLGSGAYSHTDSTHAPTVVTTPDPVIVTQPAPVIVPAPDPVIVTQPAPLIVTAPDPVVVTQPAPIVVTSPPAAP